MDYEAAYQRMLSNPAGDDTMLDHMFPNREECKAFLDWLDEKTTTAIQALSQPKFTREELVARIDSSNLLAQSFANTVLPALETPIRPWIPVGHDNHFLYRLYPKAYDLRPDSDRWDYKVELPEHVLAFQNAEEKEEFAFLQLGKLEYTKDGLTHWYATVLPSPRW
ncbi:hypothetical protein B0T25DRAFT_151566 [Lasiosphaeria hispida]|uniref:Uncharacterized protein n=1 Tax=Lasiosphaeria hispida TaxID=260671 RepID=A0AAJ0HMD8_9PEZI|nr:hypothetical protein B0T25DRAFT_151566 [Lasiosphaeria hispida]